MSSGDMIPDQVKPLSHEAAGLLRLVQPSTSYFGLQLYPCEVTTDDGVVHPRVYVVDALWYIREWGVWPWMDRGKQWLPAECIRSLRSSPDRLPAQFANMLHAAGETSMGGCSFSVELRDGRRFYYTTGNAVDFLTWPRGVTPADVIAVKHNDRVPQEMALTGSGYELAAKYTWAPYRGADETDPTPEFTKSQIQLANALNNLSL